MLATVINAMAPKLADQLASYQITISDWLKQMRNPSSRRAVHTEKGRVEFFAENGLTFYN